MKNFYKNIFCFLVFSLSLIMGANAQIANNNFNLIPYHSDPNSKIETPDSNSVPAIRFLTSTAFFPFNFRDNKGRLSGFNIDLAKEICVILDAACTMQAWPWEQVVDALKDNQGDALIAGLAISDESVLEFNFSNIYLMLPARFITRRTNSNNFDINNLEQIKLAVRANSQQALFAKKYFSQAKLVEFESEKQALEAVENLDVDVYFGDGMRASIWLNENSQCCNFVGQAYFNSDYFGQGMALAFPIVHDRVRQAVNYALVQLKKNGKLDELYLKWFPIGFY